MESAARPIAPTRSQLPTTSTVTSCVVSGATNAGCDDATGVSWYAPIVREMREVELRLRSELQSQFEELQPIVRHGALLGGKRMRPALVLLSGGAVGPLSGDHITIGVVLELLHTATLVHDDVLDAAERRRHLPTVNAQWNSGISILLGDYLFSHSFYLAATLGSTDACRLIGEAARRICEGEMRQVMSCGNAWLDEETYLELIHGKTAELTRISCLLGAMLSGASERIARSLARYGESIGIAFQIADDYLDMWGVDGQVGKTLGSDLRQGKATLPVIRLLSTASADDRLQLLEILQDAPEKRLSNLLPFLDRSDAKQYTMRRAQFFVDRALDALADLPPSDSRESLTKLAQFAVARNH
jgi:octaprenyl-diphosphate synthase